jgi:hypothetical protein
MLAEEHEPLVAIEIAEGYVREEMIAEVNLGFSSEDEGVRTGLAELSDEFGGVGPPAGWEVYCAGVEFDVTGVGEAEDERLFGGGMNLLFGLRWSGQLLRDDDGDEVLEEYEVLDIFGDGPTLGSFAEVPLSWGEAVNEFEETGFT